MIFRPLVDTIVVALDDATGGLYTQIKQLSKGNVDPMALLQAMADAQEAAVEAMADPTSFMLNVIYFFFKEALRRFKEVRCRLPLPPPATSAATSAATSMPAHTVTHQHQTRRFLREALGSAGAQAPCWEWPPPSEETSILDSINLHHTVRADPLPQWLREMYKLLKAIMLGLVPIATLPALLLGADKEGGQAANVLSLKMYQDDDPAFVQNVESFLAAVVDARDALYPAALPAAPPTALQPAGKGKGKGVNLPAFMYAFVLQNASVQFAGQMKPFMRALDQLYCILSFGIYYITDLQVSKVGLLCPQNSSRWRARRRPATPSRELSRAPLTRAAPEGGVEYGGVRTLASPRVCSPSSLSARSPLSPALHSLPSLLGSSPPAIRPPPCHVALYCTL